MFDRKSIQADMAFWLRMLLKLVLSILSVSRLLPRSWTWYSIAASLQNQPLTFFGGWNQVSWDERSKWVSSISKTTQHISEKIRKQTNALILEYWMPWPAMTASTVHARSVPVLNRILSAFSLTHVLELHKFHLHVWNCILEAEYSWNSNMVTFGMNEFKCLMCKLKSLLPPWHLKSENSLHVPGLNDKCKTMKSWNDQSKSLSEMGRSLIKLMQLDWNHS